MQTCFISSEKKKKVKISKGSGMQSSRDLKSKVVKVTATGMGQMCLRFPVADVALCTQLVLPGYSVAWYHPAKWFGFPRYCSSGTDLKLRHAKKPLSYAILGLIVTPRGRMAKKIATGADR